jgi:hypothetical protein
LRLASRKPSIVGSLIEKVPPRSADAVGVFSKTILGSEVENGEFRERMMMAICPSPKNVKLALDGIFRGSGLHPHINV